MQPLKIIVVFCAFAVVAGCAFQKYRPAPISPAQSAASLRGRTLADPGLHEFLITKLQRPPATWPLPQWDLADLTLAGLYYSPVLRVARARVSEAEAGTVTARARPNPSATGDVGGETAPENPWIAGFVASLPLETAGKRGYRIAAAEKLADVARWNLASTAWSVRTEVRSALLEYITAAQAVTLLQNEERLRAQQAQLLEQRLAVGMIPRPEVDTARIQHTQVLLAVQAAEGRDSQAETSLAAAIGVPTAALKDIKIAWPAFDQPPSAASLSPTTIQEDAVLNRIDIRRALAVYSASEAGLQSEIAKQYPDFDIGPDYAFEEGAHLFSVAVGLALPIFNRNQGPIAVAKALREQMAAEFVGVQAAGIAQSEHALARYTAALNQLAQARRLMQQSLGQEQATRTAFQAGESDRVALNGAQLQTAVTAVAQLDALHGAQQALGDLENAVQRPLLPGDIRPLSPRLPVLNSRKEK
jgi:outer membrane protein, heavy metal efflux system